MQQIPVEAIAALRYKPVKPAFGDAFAQISSVSATLDKLPDDFEDCSSKGSRRSSKVNSMELPPPSSIIDYPAKVKSMDNIRMPPHPAITYQKENEFESRSYDNLPRTEDLYDSPLKRRVSRARGHAHPVTPPKAPGNARRPQPLRTRMESNATLQAEHWFHTRMADVSLDMFGGSEVVIYSTHEIVPPSEFKHCYHSIPDHRNNKFSKEEVDALKKAMSVLVFTDMRDDAHVRDAKHLAAAITVLGAEAPPVILVPHTVSADSLQPRADPDPELFKSCLDAGFDSFIFGEPCGMRLVCEVRSKIMTEARSVETLQKKLHDHREHVKYCEDLEANVEFTVWDYFRNRLHTNIPAIDETIDPCSNRIHEYTIGEKLGEGSFGSVHKLYKDGAGTCDVVKMVRKEVLTNFQGILLLKRQIRVMELLSSEAMSHPNIIKLHEVYHSDMHVLLRMEDGGSLNLYQRMCLRDKSLKINFSSKKASSLVKQCMDVMVHLHIEAEVVHRDIKPENLIISEHGDEITVKFADFDSARSIKPGALVSGRVGTVPFMAPEVALEKKKYDPYAADIWSMGIVFLEVMCFVDLFKKFTMEGVKEHFAANHAVENLLDRCCRWELKDISDDVLVLVEGMMNIVPSCRWTATHWCEASPALFSEVKEDITENTEVA